jgi:hypothetical protein
VIWSWDEFEYNKLTQLQNWPLPESAKMLIYPVESELQFLLLTPGDYKVGVVVRYHLEGDPQNINKTAIQAALVHISAPELVILIGAATGGLLGYIISRIYLSEKRPLKGRFAILVGMLGSMLLSAIVTILLAHISETQFLVRINITDLWGAIAVGFISSIVGFRILDNFIPDMKSSRSEGTGPKSESTPAEDTGQKSESISTQTATSANGRPAFSQIQLRAYQISERRRANGTQGVEVSDWAQAEKELQQEAIGKLTALGLRLPG